VLSDPKQTAILLVCLPENMPANETIDLWHRLGSSYQKQVNAIIYNALLPRYISEEEWSASQPGFLQSDVPVLKETGTLMNQWMNRLKIQQAIRQRLREEISAPICDLPYAPPKSIDDFHSLGEQILNRGTP